MNIPNVIFAIIAAVVGVLVGGVINMLSDDLPFTNQISRPHYNDETPRPFLGLIAFLTRRRIAPDGTKLSWRHPLVEIVTALLFVYVAYVYGVSGVALFWLGGLAIPILITVID